MSDAVVERAVFIYFIWCLALIFRDLECLYKCAPQLIRFSVLCNICSKLPGYTTFNRHRPYACTKTDFLSHESISHAQIAYKRRLHDTPLKTIKNLNMGFSVTKCQIGVKLTPKFTTRMTPKLQKMSKFSNTKTKSNVSLFRYILLIDTDKDTTTLNYTTVNRILTTSINIKRKNLIQLKKNYYLNQFHKNLK